YPWDLWVRHLDLLWRTRPGGLPALRDRSGYGSQPASQQSRIQADPQQHFISGRREGKAENLIATGDVHPAGCQTCTSDRRIRAPRITSELSQIQKEPRGTRRQEGA